MRYQVMELATAARTKQRRQLVFLGLHWPAWFAGHRSERLVWEAHIDGRLRSFAHISHRTAYVLKTGRKRGRFNPLMWVRTVQLDLDEALTLAQFSLRDAHALSPVEYADALREVAA